MQCVWQLQPDRPKLAVVVQLRAPAATILLPACKCLAGAVLVVCGRRRSTGCGTRLWSQMRAAAVKHELDPAGEEALGLVQGRPCRDGSEHRAAAGNARERHGEREQRRERAQVQDCSAE
jgi:hypothetical protein